MPPDNSTRENPLSDDWHRNWHRYWPRACAAAGNRRCGPSSGARIAAIVLHCKIAGSARRAVCRGSVRTRHEPFAITDELAIGEPRLADFGKAELVVEGDRTGIRGLEIDLADDPIVPRRVGPVAKGFV